MALSGSTNSTHLRAFNILKCQQIHKEVPPHKLSFWLMVITSTLAWEIAHFHNNSLNDRPGNAVIIKKVVLQKC